VKSLLYTAGLLAVLVASVVLLRSIDGEREPVDVEEGATPVVESASPSPSRIDLGDYKDSPIGELFAAGSELFGLWHERDAALLFEQAVRADSSFYSAWVTLVECYSHPLVGREDDARAALEQARRWRPNEADTVFLAGLDRLFVVRDFVAAASILERAVDAEPSPLDAGYYFALALFLSGRAAEAQRVAREQGAQGDRAGRLAELDIRCSLGTGEYDAAVEKARELAKVNAEEPYPYVILALVEQMAGRPETAVEFCNNALVLDSKFVPAILARSNLYAAAGKFAAARVSFEKLLLFEDPLLKAFGYEGIGFVDLLSGRFTDAVDELDEAIRCAMLAGAVRHGLTIATQLVGYLCELGRGEAAVAVVDRWVTGFGEIPVALAGLRINVLEGELEAAGGALGSIQSSKDWSEWAGMLSIDSVEMTALVHIGAEQYDAALGILSTQTSSVAGKKGSRMFLKGFASFDSGEAEAAAEAFSAVGKLLYGVEFPYHGDAVQYVRSQFYLGETSIARGNESEAAAYYERFLSHWGDADWDVQAVTRARERLGSLGTSLSQ
jgi:tetratricopeptide (TPR) repeat protein